MFVYRCILLIYIMHLSIKSYCELWYAFLFEMGWNGDEFFVLFLALSIIDHKMTYLHNLSPLRTRMRRSKRTTAAARDWRRSTLKSSVCRQDIPASTAREQTPPATMVTTRPQKSPRCDSHFVVKA